MRKKHQVLLVLFLAVASIGAGCQQNPTQPPTDTQQQAVARAWSKMVDYFGVIETSRHTANQIALGLSQQNPPLVPVSVLESFVKVNDWTIKANGLLQASKDNFDQPIAAQVIALAGQILTELATIPPGLPSGPVDGAATSISAEVAKMEEAANGVKELEGTWTR